jgi:hypothetical protein
MSKLFSKPEVQAAPAPKALPREDDEAARRERIKKFSELQKTSGRESNRLTPSGESRLGDYAPTRGSAVLSG